MMTTIPTKLMCCHIEVNDFFLDIATIPLQESMETALIIKDLDEILLLFSPLLPLVPL